MRDGDKMKVTKQQLMRAFKLMALDFTDERCPIDFEDTEGVYARFWDCCGDCLCADRTDEKRHKCLLEFYVRLAKDEDGAR